MADDIRIFDFDTKQITNITNTNTQEIFPMWIGGKIFFLSDRDRTMNLFCYDLKTQETKKVTNFYRLRYQISVILRQHHRF